METFQTEISKVESPQLRLLFEQLYKLLETKDRDITDLKNQVQSLEERVNEIEKYSSKDCLIIDNMPLGDSKWNLEIQVCNFLKNYLNYESHPSNFKACHFLGKFEAGKKQPPVIVKFIYFGEKSEIYGRKSWLAGKKNPINGRSIFLRERLPVHQKQIKEKAEEFGLVTTTLNCEVKVFENSQGKFTSRAVKTLRAVEDIKDIAVKRNNSTKRKQFNMGYETPAPQTQEDVLKSLLKRIRESPDDADSLAVLKHFRFDSGQLVAD